MLKLIKFSIFLAGIFAAGYFLLGVSFGDQTLYQHLVGISETNEVKALKHEIDKKVDSATSNIKQKAKDLAIKKVKQELDEVKKKKEASKNADTRREAGGDKVSGSDRAALEALIEEKQHAEHLTADRRSLERLIQQKVRE